jgi:N-glycosylase/DNA lyase
LQQQYLINIDYSINSGQVFLWEKNGDIWHGINGVDVLAVKENPFQINSFSQNSIDFFREKDELREIIQSIRSLSMLHFFYCFIQFKHSTH